MPEPPVPTATRATSPLLAPGVDVEVATWRPAEVERVDGWVLGFSGGLTRRGNSVVAATEPSDLTAALEQVEARYSARGPPTTFRVDADARPSHLDALLEGRGYRAVATTHVLVRDLVDRDGEPGGGSLPERTRPSGNRVADEPDEAWLRGWLDVKVAGVTDAGLARRLLTGSSATYLTARDLSGVTGVIRAGYADDWVGLSCLMVAARARRRGLARSLTLDAMDVALARGARRAFLQVEADNDPARVLYEGLGFRLAQTYHYRER